MDNVVRKTVVELDLVGYSDILANLEEGLTVSSSQELNDQIQGFITAGLQSLGLPREGYVVDETGDGAIVVFDSAAIAHLFVTAVHAGTQQHNARLTKSLAKRVFRVGVATGEIVMRLKPGGVDIAGVAIARAVRLEGKAVPGGVLIDQATWLALSPDLQSLYGAQLAVAGKRDEEFLAFPRAVNANGPADALFFTARSAERREGAAPNVDDGPPRQQGGQAHEDGQPQPATAGARGGAARAKRQALLDRFKALKRDKYNELMFLLEMPLDRRPQGDYDLASLRERVLLWAEEEDLLDDLATLLADLTGSDPT